MTSKASPISFRVLIPVDRMMGLFFSAMYLSRGRSIISPDATLNAGTPKSSSKSTLSLSKAEDKKIILFFSA